MRTQEKKPKVEISIFISIFALLVSAVTFYWGYLKPRDLSFFSSPSVQIGRDWKSDLESIALPITITNSGANSSIVNYIKLVVDHPSTNRKKVFKSLYFNKLINIEGNFSPIHIPGHGSATKSIGFYPLYNEEKKIFGERGVYTFTLYFFGVDQNDKPVGEITFNHTPTQQEIDQFRSKVTYSAIKDSWRNSQRITN